VARGREKTPKEAQEDLGVGPETEEISRPKMNIPPRQEEMNLPRQEDQKKVPDLIEGSQEIDHMRNLVTELHLLAEILTEGLLHRRAAAANVEKGHFHQ